MNNTAMSEDQFEKAAMEISALMITLHAYGVSREAVMLKGYDAALGVIQRAYPAAIAEAVLIEKALDLFRNAAGYYEQEELEHRLAEAWS